MKAEAKIKLSQLGFTTIEIDAIEKLPDLIKTINELKSKVEENQQNK